MTQSCSGRCWKLYLAIIVAICGAIASFGGCAFAQLKPDATLGSESSVVKPNVVIKDLPSDQIDGGARRGANLLHSFLEFNVSEGRRAYFYSPSADIQNILARVTGSNPSKIMGVLGTYGNSQPNLFLINPNGIIFGPSARLDVSGSFVASTAKSVIFADGNQFNANGSETPPLLRVSVPVGLQFGDSAADISVQGAFLEVQPGKTLALVGGNLTVEGGYLNAEGGRIELGSVAGTSQVRLNSTDQGWTLAYGNVQNFQDIQLSQQAVVNASGEGSGDIQVQGRRVMLSDGSQIMVTTLGLKPGGTLTVTASESVELVGISSGTNSGLFTIAAANGTAGDTIINTRRLLVHGGAIISTESAGLGGSGQVIPATGRGGNLTVIAPESVELVDGLLSSRTRGSGDAGNVRIKTERLFVQGEQAGVSLSSAGKKNAGNLEVTARSIHLDNRGALKAESISGEGGNITLQQVQDLLLRRNSEISTDTDGDGNGGNITIDTDILAALENSKITADAVRGRGGNIKITTQGLFLSPDSKITASSERGIDGVVEIIRPDIDPSSGLVALPTELVDVTGLIAQGCPTGEGNVARGSSEFIVTGRGGLPPNPEEALRSDPALADLGTLVQGTENRASAAIPSNLTNSEPTRLVEAQGWVIGSKGEVILTAQAPNVTPYVSWLTPSTICNGS